MSAVTSSPLSLSAEWIPTLLQTSKEVRRKVNGEGKREEEWEEKKRGWISGVIQEGQGRAIKKRGAMNNKRGGDGFFKMAQRD